MVFNLLPTTLDYDIAAVIRRNGLSSLPSSRIALTRLSNKLLEQGYVKERLKSSLRKFYGRYGDFIKQYEVSLSQMLNDIL